HVVPIIFVPTGRGNACIKIVSSAQMPFADKCAMNAFIREALTDGMLGVAHRHAVAPNAVGMRIESGPDGRARRRANRLAIIGLLKANALRGNAIEVGSL